MDKPSVSIIVPVYNVESYVEACIYSVIRQTYDGVMECVVVDDCGIDGSMEKAEIIISEYDGPTSFKILHHDHNRGLSAARNTGMDASSGDYLFFLDSDDELTDNCIEMLANPLGFELYDLVLGDQIRVRQTKEQQWEEVETNFRLHLDNNTVLRGRDILRSHKKGWNQLAQNKLYRSGFIRDNHLRFKEGLLHEDNLWGFQVACVASSLYAVNSVTYYWKERKGSITSSPNAREEKAAALKTTLQEMGRFVKERQLCYTDTFPFFTNFFEYVLNFSSAAKLDFISNYKELRPLFRASMKCLIRKDHLTIRRYIRDLHYLMPRIAAAYWQFYLIKLMTSRHRSQLRFLR